MKKWSSHGYLLEHLESSGTKIMSEPIVCQLCNEETEKHRKILKDELHGFFSQLKNFFFCAVGLLP